MYLSALSLAILSFRYAEAAPFEAAARALELASSAYVLNRLGMTITQFPNMTAAKASDEYKSSSPESPSFLLCNNHNSTNVSAVGEINFANGAKIRTSMSDPKYKKHKSALVILPGTCTLVGNVTSDVGDHTFSGAFRGYIGCDSNGLNCSGKDNIVTKVEFATNANKLHKNAWGINLSLVDGFNGDVNMTAGEGKDEISLACHIDPTVLREACPATHLIDDRGDGFPSCRSDCAAFGGDMYCCTGKYDSPAACPPSNLHLEKLCGKGGAYSWPHDDKKYHEVKMDKALEIVFGPQNVIATIALNSKGKKSSKKSKKIL